MHTFTYAEAGNICPLCKHPAKCTLHDDNNQKYVRCDNCNEFVITCIAEQLLSPYPVAFLEQYSAQSKKSNGERLLLIKRPLVNSREVVHMEWELRSKKIV